MHYRIIYRTDAIQSDSQPHHIKLCSRKALYTGRITNMTKYFIRKRLLQQHGSLFKSFYLFTRKSIELLSVASYKMGEYRTGNNRILSFQTFYEPGHIFRSKSQPVHAGIQFHMNGKIGDTFFLSFFNQRIQQMETVNFRFQFIVEHRLECRHLRIHNDNACRNARFT